MQRKPLKPPEAHNEVKHLFLAAKHSNPLSPSKFCHSKFPTSKNLKGDPSISHMKGSNPKTLGAATKTTIPAPPSIDVRVDHGGRFRIRSRHQDQTRIQHVGLVKRDLHPKKHVFWRKRTGKQYKKVDTFQNTFNE